ncbi:MAG: hypothetical protein V7637_6001 [Mycobacteriales bacterium]
MAFGCVDLRPGSDVDEFLSALGEAVRETASPGEPLTVNVQEHGGRPRLSLHANYGNTWFGPVLVRAAAATGTVERAVLGLDHDEYGIEHVVLAGGDGGLARVQHIYVHPDGEPRPDHEPMFVGVPVRDGLTAAADGTVAGPASWAVVAALYDVPPDRVIAVARYDESAHEELGVVFAPFKPWWDALGLVYPGDLGPPDHTFVGPG